MFPEALVLGRDEGLLHAGGDGLDRHEDAPLGRQFRGQAGIRGVDAAHLRRVVIRQPAVIRQVLRDLAIEPVAGHAGDDAAGDHQGQQQADQAEPTAAAALLPRGAGARRAFVARFRRLGRFWGRCRPRPGPLPAGRVEGCVGTEVMGGHRYIDTPPGRPARHIGRGRRRMVVVSPPGPESGRPPASPPRPAPGRRPASRGGRAASAPPRRAGLTGSRARPGRRGSPAP